MAKGKASVKKAVLPGKGSNQPNLKGMSRKSITRSSGSQGAIKYGGFKTSGIGGKI